MTNSRRLVIPALITAGVLWGTTVPLSKLALAWMAPAWLAFARFGLAAAVLMVASRSRLRRAASPAILVSGGIGYGASVLLQNFGIERTSVTHAALLIGATPVLVAIIAATLRHSVARPLAWAGFALSLAGVGFIASGQGSGSTLGGDGLVLAAQLVSAGFTVSQARLLRGRDPVAVTGLQLMAAAVMVLPIALMTGPHMTGPVSGTALLATLGLVLGGTVGPTALFAFGQSRVAADVAGAFLNIEPLVGALLGVALFADPVGPVQIGGGAAIVSGIALSSFQVARGERLRSASRSATAAAPAARAAASAGAAAAMAGAAAASAGAVAPSVRPSARASPAAPRARPAAAAGRTAVRLPGEAPSLVPRTRFPQVPADDTGRLAWAIRPAGRATRRFAARRQFAASRRFAARRRFAAGRRSLTGRGPSARHDRGSRTRRGRARMR
jgi:O-acetylserine/cysteine efflux transporter